MNGFAALFPYSHFMRVAHFRQSCFVFSMGCRSPGRRTSTLVALVSLLFLPITLVFMDYALSVQFFEHVKLYFISHDGMELFHITCVTDFVQKVFI